MSRICLVVDFTVKPGTKTQFLDIIREHASKTLEHEEGCLQFEVCDPVEGEHRVFLYEVYADDAAFEVHKASPTLARTRARYADLVESRHIHVCRVLQAGRPAMITLYGSPVSGNAYKARLLLSLLGIEFEETVIDLQAGENRTAEFLALNPRGQIPTLVDGEVTVWDSQAILVYLARRYGEAWLPVAPAAMAEVMQWLAVSENELLFGLARARAVKYFGRDFDLSSCQTYGHAGLKVLEQRLGEHRWLAAGRPTIADVACMPYVALSHMGGIPLDDYPAVRAWVDRVRALPGFIAMEGIREPARAERP